MAFFALAAVFNIAHLGGTGRDKADADVLFRKLGVLSCRIFLCQHGGDFHGRQHLHDIFAKIGKAEAYKPHDHGAGRAYDRLFDPFPFHIFPCVIRHHFGGSGDLVNFVKSEIRKPLKHIVDVVEIVKLTVKRGRGQGDFPLETGYFRKLVINRLFCLIGTDPNTFAAVDTAGGIDNRMALPDSDGLGGTVLKAVGTALALFPVKQNRMTICIHALTSF